MLKGNVKCKSCKSKDGYKGKTPERVCKVFVVLCQNLKTGKNKKDTRRRRNVYKSGVFFMLLSCKTIF